MNRRNLALVAATTCLVLSACGDDAAAPEERPTENVGTGSSEPAPIDESAIDDAIDGS